MKEALVVTRRDLVRISVMEQVITGKATLAEAAQLMNRSYRQAKRVLKRFREQGVKGIPHANRGKKSNRKIDEDLKQEILQRYEERYVGFGPTLACEKLFDEGLEVDHETLRRWLLSKGLIERQRRSCIHRSRRERKHCFGEMVQIDGSHHRWFEDRGQECCLMSMVDDATGTAVYLLSEEESSEAVLTILSIWIALYGIPHSMYVDGLNVYGARKTLTLEEQLEGVEATGTFEKACQKLGITLILARSPQAKGRVERRHGVLQDRLVKEFRLCGISSINEGNRLIQDSFTKVLNDKLSVLPVSGTDFHHRVDPKLDLRCVLCWEKLHTVGHDWVVRHRSRYYQILKENRPRPRPQDHVIVQDWLDGTLHVYFKDTELKIQDVTDISRQRKAV